MMTMTIAVTRLIFFFAIFGIAKAGSMYMLEAGLMGKKGPILVDGFKICPETFSTKGFSIVCDITSPYAVFFIGGKWERRESYKPFTIAGDTMGSAEPWKNVPAGELEIRCTGETESVAVKGSFDCTPEAQSETEIETEEEEDLVASPAPTVTPSPQGEPVEEIISVGVDEKYCVTIPALSYEKDPPISNEWAVLDDGSLSYLPDNNRTWTVRAHQAPVTYKFTVPIASTYGITMDSETPHKTEHNDIWITFDSITLRGKDEETGNRTVLSGIKEPLKAYQNTAGRSKIASSVDFNPHTFSTTEILMPGREYTIIVGARSTMFKLFGLILFPCTGEECVSGQWHWQQYLGKCNI